MAVANGRIVQLNCSAANVYVKLDLPSGQHPLKGFFRLSLARPWDARYENLMLAVTLDRPVQIRTSAPITPDRYGEINIVALHVDPGP